VSLEAGAKYSTATTLFSSLATGGGDEEDTAADVDDEATNVRERDIVLVHEAKAIKDMSNTTSLGSLRAATWQRTLRSL
jgi:hypothetical protein